jgi:hypothetical protein
MINHLDNLLRHILMTQVAGITAETQVGFQPPDEAWRTHVSGLATKNALNVYLVDLRENRKLRSNARVRSVENGIVQEDPAPARMDCHYLVTAWSPVGVTQAVEPTIDEHELLYEVTAVLINNAPLNPSHIYPEGSAAVAAWGEYGKQDLPTQVLPVEGFPKLPEFWGTMGVNYRWKPAVYLVVTLPVTLKTEVAGPMVTTTITEYRQRGKPDTAEVWIQIGGHVLDARQDPPVPVSKAWVRLEDEGGVPLKTTETNDLGRFIFGELQPGRYQLNWRAEGFPAPAAPHVIDVPSQTGEYDLKFE